MSEYRVAAVQEFTGKGIVKLFGIGTYEGVGVPPVFASGQASDRNRRKGLPVPTFKLEDKSIIYATECHIMSLETFHSYTRVRRVDFWKARQDYLQQTAATKAAGATQ